MVAGEVILGPELINGGDLLVTTQTIQELLDDADPLARPQIADMFGDIVGNEPTHFGASKVELHASTAYLFDDGQTNESTLLPYVQMEGAWLSGKLGPIVYFEFGIDRPILSWTLQYSTLRGVEVYDGAKPEDLIADAVYASGADIRRPVYVPVSGIQTALVAA